MPWRRQTAAAPPPASCSFRIVVICSSLNRLRRIRESFPGPLAPRTLIIVGPVFGGHVTAPIRLFTYRDRLYRTLSVWSAGNPLFSLKRHGFPGYIHLEHLPPGGMPTVDGLHMPPVS